MTDCKLDGSEFGLNALQCSQFLPFNSQSFSFQLQLAILQPLMFVKFRSVTSLPSLNVLFLLCM